MKRAMLLAAGRGERLRPLTDTVPKPLLTVGSHTLIEHNLMRLKAAGVEEVVINVSYRAQQIIDVVGDGNAYGLKVTYSFEPNQPLGTGGGIFQALRFFEDEPFVLLSSDIWTDYPFEKLTLPEGKYAHLVMVGNPDFHPGGDYALLPSGLLAYGSEPKVTYSNISVVHPHLFKNCEPIIFPLSPLFSQEMQHEKITGELYAGEWFNVGTTEELKRLEQMLTKKI